MTNAPQFENIKKLDKYAKSLGMTIYELTYGFIKDNKLERVIAHDVNMTPERTKLYPGFKGLVQSI